MLKQIIILLLLINTLINCTTVSIIGAGVSGLTASLELIERGYQVNIYEHDYIPGGKVKGYNTDGTNYPVEHGFHFFPRNYLNIPDTFKKIPYKDSNVFEHLAYPTALYLAHADNKSIEIPLPITNINITEFNNILKSLSNVNDANTLFNGITKLIMKSIDGMLGIFGWNVTDEEKVFFAERLTSYLLSCDDRQREQFERMSWLELLVPGERSYWSTDYFDLVTHGLAENIVACNAEILSANCQASVAFGLLWGVLGWGFGDRILDGPVNDVWVDPLVELLKSKGANITYGQTLKRVNFNGKSIANFEMVDEASNTKYKLESDYYLIAIPVERLIDVVVESGRREFYENAPQFKNIEKLQVANMNGFYIFLEEDVPISNGHLDFIQSGWSLCGISEVQFWGDVDLSQYGPHNGTDRPLGGVLALIISNWTTPGLQTHKSASECTVDELFEEIFYQVNYYTGGNTLKRSNVIDYWIDTDVALGTKKNKEPLLLNTVGSWWNRPESTATDIDNLFITGDFIQSDFNLASAETADESGRLAVNQILKADNSTQKPVEIFQYSLPDELQIVIQPLKALDVLTFESDENSKPPFWPKAPNGAN